MLVRVSRRCFCTASPQPWLFIGLGNPGEKYEGTRHNVGFEMIDAFAESQGISMDKVQCKAFFGQGFVGNVPVLLAKPQTYMNLSGESTGPLAAYFKLPLNRVLVLFDDMDLPCGVLRLQPNGGHGSHNGSSTMAHPGDHDDAPLPHVILRPDLFDTAQAEALYTTSFEDLGIEFGRPVKTDELRPFRVKERLQALGWDHLMEEDLPVYPELVRYFYSNLTYTTEAAGQDDFRLVISSRVRETRFRFSTRTLAHILGVPYVHSERWWFPTALDDSESIPPQELSEICSVLWKDEQITTPQLATSLRPSCRVLARIVGRNIIPKAGHHSLLHPMEAFVVYCMYVGHSIDLAYIIQRGMMERVDFPRVKNLAFGRLLTRVFRHFEVSLEDTPMLHRELGVHIGTVTVTKMRLRNFQGSEDEDDGDDDGHDGDDGGHDGHEEIPMQEEHDDVPPRVMETGGPSHHMPYENPPWTRMISMMEQMQIQQGQMASTLGRMQDEMRDGFRRFDGRLTRLEGTSSLRTYYRGSAFRRRPRRQD